MIRRELDAALAPLQKMVNRLEQGLESLETVRRVTEQLSPLLRKQGQQVVLQAVQTQAPAVAKKGAATRAAPAAAAAAAAAPVAPVTRARGRPKAAGGAQACAVIGCKRPSRSKGYCSAHYQKLRLLIKTGRRPKDWVDDAAPQSAQDLKLPRGRAAANAASEREAAAPAKQKDPPKPKAWVRKKGKPGMVSLH
ncbi:MAG TPA: cell wall protein [Myxococcaceae bacterium]|nr:cell wall protein [Myxococcaceae bacterium]